MKTAQEAAGGSGKYDVFCTQGQGGGIDASYDSLKEALDHVDREKGSGSFAIRYPDGRWHKWR